jgi:glycosyltransferase involved in cell wall biosynthesis
MNILIVNPSVIPALLYGGTERVIWYLGKELHKLGHKITYLVAPGSSSDFADIIAFDRQKSINEQIPEDIDIVHFNFPVRERILKPNITTIHGNSSPNEEFDINTVFVSQNHATRHSSDSFVYNGLDWNDYGTPNFTNDRQYFHFLANAAWKVKNLKGTMNICNQAGEKLAVLGGKRLNFKMGFRFTFNPNVKFYGMVGGEKKLSLISGSKGLIFPVLWDEPFGLALTESMFLGCPVFGTDYGSLPEIVIKETGFLSNNSGQIVQAIQNADSFNRRLISDYAREKFDSKTMALEYLKKYELVLSGKTLNQVRPKHSNEFDNKIYSLK